MNDALELAVKKEIESGEFNNKITKVCSWCGAKKPDSIEHYMHCGNACNECNTRFGKIIGGVRGFRKGKLGKNVSYKIREYTEEEKEQMIKQRLEDVKNNNL